MTRSLRKQLKWNFSKHQNLYIKISQIWRRFQKINNFGSKNETWVRHLKFCRILSRILLASISWNIQTGKYAFSTFFLEVSKCNGSKSLVLIKFYLSKRKLQEISARSNIALARQFTQIFYLISPPKLSPQAPIWLFLIKLGNKYINVQYFIPIWKFLRYPGCQKGLKLFYLIFGPWTRPTLREEILVGRNFGERAHSPILVQFCGIYFGDLIKLLNLATINFGERPIF